jgi:hypothetical protein
MAKRRASNEKRAEGESEAAAAVDRLTDNVRVVWQTLDEIRDDLQWALRNVAQAAEVLRPMRVTSMALDPRDPEWGSKLNALRPEDVAPEPAEGTKVTVDAEQFNDALDILVRSGKVRVEGERVTLTAGDFASAMESVDRLVYCCENPALVWDGPPEAPNVLCRSCGYVVAEYGEVVDDREERAADGAAFTGPPKPSQGLLWSETEEADGA